MVRVFSAVIHREGAVYVADCPELGTVSQGHSIEEALVNLKEASELFLEEAEPEPASPPILATFSVDTARA